MQKKSWRYHMVTAALAASPVLIYVTSWIERVGKPWHERLQTAAQIWAVVAFIVSVLLYRVDAAYLAWQKFVRLVLNAEIHWDLAARYNIVAAGVNSQGAFNSLVDHATTMPRCRVRLRQARRAILSLQGIPVEVRLIDNMTLDGDQPVEEPQLVVEILDATTAYRALIRFVQGPLAMLLEQAQLTSASKERLFELKFTFPSDRNPFFGLLVKRLSSANAGFTFSYRAQTENKGTVAVHRDSVSLATTSWPELNLYFKKLVALSAEPLQIS